MSNLWVMVYGQESERFAEKWKRRERERRRLPVSICFVLLPCQSSGAKVNRRVVMSLSTWEMKNAIPHEKWKNAIPAEVGLKVSQYCLGHNTLLWEWLLLYEYLHPFEFQDNEKWKWKSFSRVCLFVTPWTIQSMEFSRPDYWVGNPGIKPRSSALQDNNYSLLVTST